MKNDEKRRIEALETLMEIEQDRARQELSIWDCEIMQKYIQELRKTAFGETGPNGPSKTLELRKETEQIKPQSKMPESSEEPKADGLTYLLLEREIAWGVSREHAKEKWGPIFNERAWNELMEAKAQECSSEVECPRSNIAILRREYLCGLSREQAKERWGADFDDKSWDYVEKIGRFDPGEPHPRDILKSEQDHPRLRNEGMEKQGPLIEEEITRDLDRARWKNWPKYPVKAPATNNQPQRDGPEMDRD